MMPLNPIVGGTVLRIPAIQSPNFVSGVSGWTINADGTAQFNQLTIIVQASGAALLIYNGAAGPGNLIGSWASVAGADQYGNAYPAGISAIQGSLSGVLLTNPTITGALMSASSVAGTNISTSSITGGTMTETAITFDTAGGTLLVYATTTTTTSFTTAGINTFSVPAGVTSGRIQCWGADAGAGGGSGSKGGEGGGAGEYAEEPNFPLTPGDQCAVFVGSGGTGGTTGSGGSGGDNSFFETGSGNVAVFANGGNAGINFTGGTGGTGSANTIHFNGGNGGGDNTQSTGGCGGGGRAGSTGAGGNGAKSTTSTGAAGGSAGAGTGGHVGGAGGNNAANGNNGGGGGGCGASTSATTGSNTYRLSTSQTFLGSDGSPANSQRGTSTMYQGGETAGGGTANGTMKSLGIISGSPSTDLSGKTIDSVFIRLNQLHSWFNSGATVVLGYNNRTSIPSTYNGADITSILTYSQANGVHTQNLTNHGFGSALQSGAAKAITLGPGPAFNLNYYSYYYGAGGDNSLNPLITVNWHTGAAPVTAGNGADGRVDVTVTSGSTLIAAISAVAGNDAPGNQFAAAYTGAVTAFVPASSPTIAETVHNMPAMSNSWAVGVGGEAKYQLDSTGCLQFSFILNTPGTKTDGITLWAAGSLPAGYRPAVAKRWPISTGTAAVSTNNTPSITFGTDGSITATGINTAGALTHVDAHGVMPLF